jgi:imidazoleglycerol-phosphate dehydratase/histidinol-phosphatase
VNRKKILFIDRDGTIIKEPATDFQVDNLNKFSFIPGVIGALRHIVEKTDYRLVMVSNQDGLGTAAFPTADFLPCHQLMLDTLSGEGVRFDEVLIDKSFPADNSPNRKPRTGMVEKYLNDLLDYDHSYVIGDRPTDVELAKNMGIRSIRLVTAADGDVPPSPDTKAEALTFSSWNDISRFLIRGSRQATVTRTTAETDISVTLDLNGTGQCAVNTGIPFFDHMLEQIARHGGMDLHLAVDGDLEVDEHHTIEDSGIALGNAFREALGSKKGIERYAFALPMDEAKAEMLLDFGGRAYLAWNVAPFDREYVGEFPTEMAKHFFGSFCEAAKCNLHIAASGENAHHILEAIFKTFAKCLREAVRQTGTGIPSSKGII